MPDQLPDQLTDESLSVKYDKAFFDNQASGSARSASRTIPLVVDLINPKSVVDVGCGRGTWLAEFQRQGATDVLGFDCSPIDPSDLSINPDEYQVMDFTKDNPIDRKFDLAVSLEVAEHLPQASAQHFVNMLTDLSPVVLFSAAVLGQGGDHHLNEQWPDYWAKLFDQHNFGFCDVLRLQLWDDEHVEPWYAQNMLLYLDRSQSHRFPKLMPHLSMPGAAPRAMVHPEIFELRVTEAAKLRRRLNRLKPWKLIKK